MTDTVGIKETSEVIKAILVVGVFMIERFRDGVDWSDAIAIGSKIAMDDQFRKVITDAIEGSDQLGIEIKDLKADELGVIIAEFLPEILKLLSEMKS